MENELLGSDSHTFDLKPAAGFGYNFRKWFNICIACFSYMFVYFHRFTTAVLATDMARDLNVPKAKLGIFTSMYFWPYGILQPFIGIISDVLETGYVIAFSNLLSATGSLICGLSSSFGLCCFGRFLVGFGCSGIFVSTTKIGANWFSPAGYRLFSGFLIGLGGCGSLLSQAPLAALGAAIGWRWCLKGVAILSILACILSILFVRGHPKTLGYYSDIQLPEKVNFRATMIQLLHNFEAVAKNAEFWFLEFFMFLGPGIFMDVSAMWSISFLEDVLKYSSKKASFVQMTLSISIVIGSPSLPLIAEKAHISRKKILIVFVTLSLISSVILIFATENLSIYILIVCYFFFSVGASSSQGTLLAMFKELGSIELSGTFVGCGNLGPFIGGAILQTISSEIIRTYGNLKHYPKESYQIGLWGLTAVCLVLGLLSLILVREPKPQTSYHK